ncbi:MAG: hypothetical protein ABSG15_08360, partial [FCB group bacterium]
MDKRTILGFVLIAIIVIVWMFYSSLNERPIPKNTKTNTESSSTISNDTSLTKEQDTTSIPASLTNDTLANKEIYGKYFTDFTKGNDEIIRIETDVSKIMISNKGASILRWELKNYKMWNGYPTDLIWNDKGEIFLSFLTNENKKIDSRDLYFKFAPDTQNK